MLRETPAPIDFSSPLSEIGERSVGESFEKAQVQVLAFYDGVASPW
jgi:hypothetical protein